MERSIISLKMSDSRYTLGSLSVEAGIDIVRLSDIRLDKCPDVTEKEKAALEKILGCDLSYLMGEEYRVQAKKRKEGDEQMLAAIGEAIRIIRAEKNKFGQIECPICGEAIVYAVHGNGHIWFKCRGEDCLTLMQ